jgi:hypothetical protein
VLTGLRPKVRAYFQAGRFVGAEGSDAVFALPNAVHVAQAEPLRSEVVDALGAHFGRAVGLRLVVEGTWSPPATTAPTSVDLGHSEAPTADGPGEAVTARAVGQEHDSSEATGATREEYPPSRARPRARAASLRAPVPAAPDTEPAEAAFPDEEDETDEGVPVGEPEDGRSAAPGTGLAWAEDRLLQAFPGAEEV